jgi:hypothetical protein
LQVDVNGRIKYIDIDIKDKNSKGKKFSWIRALLKRAARHLRREHKKINPDD